MTAQAAGQDVGEAVTADEVRSFLEEVHLSSVVESKSTRSLNENRFRKTKWGYSSEAVIQLEAGEVSATVDLLAKENERR